MMDGELGHSGGSGLCYCLPTNPSRKVQIYMTGFTDDFTNQECM